MDIKAQVCTSTFVKTHKPPAEMMASAHRTTSSSYSPLFTTFTSVPLLLKTHKSSQSSPFWKKDVKGGKKKILSMQGTCFTEGIRTIRKRAGSAKLCVIS